MSASGLEVVWKGLELISMVHTGLRCVSASGLEVVWKGLVLI